MNKLYIETAIKELDYRWLGEDSVLYSRALDSACSRMSKKPRIYGAEAYADALITVFGERAVKLSQTQVMVDGIRVEFTADSTYSILMSFPGYDTSVDIKDLSNMAAADLVQVFRYCVYALATIRGTQPEFEVEEELKEMGATLLNKWALECREWQEKERRYQLSSEFRRAMESIRRSEETLDVIQSKMKETAEKYLEKGVSESDVQYSLRTNLEQSAQNVAYAVMREFERELQDLILCSEDTTALFNSFSQRMELELCGWPYDYKSLWESRVRSYKRECKKIEKSIAVSNLLDTLKTDPNFAKGLEITKKNPLYDKSYTAIEVKMVKGSMTFKLYDKQAELLVPAARAIVPLMNEVMAYITAVPQIVKFGCKYNRSAQVRKFNKHEDVQVASLSAAIGTACKSSCVSDVCKSFVEVMMCFPEKEAAICFHVRKPASEDEAQAFAAALAKLEKEDAARRKDFPAMRYVF